MSDIMPAPSLIEHEWTSHGACSGFDPAGFFAQVRRAYASINLPPELAGRGMAPLQTTAAVTDDFVRANPGLPPRSLLVTCGGQDVPRLREVRLCFTRGLEPRACAPDALRAGCRSDRLLVPPIR